MFDAVDRIAPTRRPPGLGVMRQSWHDLLFLHWSVPAEALRPRVPPELEVDTFGGRAYVGLVPFGMRGVRLPGLPPVRGLSSFLEVNVRTYVHRDGRDPGVWFFSLDAASTPAVLFARRFWHLPYHRARMSLERGRGAGVGAVVYRSERLWPGPTPASCRVAYRPLGEPSPAPPGTLEHFLAERYLLYCRRGGTLYRGRVHHAPYPLRPAEVLDLDESLLAAAGLERPDEPPLAHQSAGVRVRIYALRAAADAPRREPVGPSGGRAA